MTGQEKFNIDNVIPDFGDRLAQKMPPSKLNFFAELCDAGRIRWEDIAVSAIAQCAIGELRKRTVAIEIVNIRDRVGGKVQVVDTVILMEEDVRFLQLPDHLVMRRIKMTDHLFDSLKIETTEEVENDLAKQGVVA